MPIMSEKLKSIRRNLINNISKIVKEYFTNNTVFSITDYKEKNKFVIFAVPNDQVNNADQWTDGLYSIDKRTFEVNGFNPLLNDPYIYFNLPKDRIIYKRLML